MADADPLSGRTYLYSHEISQMVFVFTGVSDVGDEVCWVIEDIVRAQCVELLVQSRRLAGRRQAKFLSPEDVIFLIRHDRAKVNRLRTYLSWKDVRKNARESGGDAPGGGGPEIDPLADPDAAGAGAPDPSIRPGGTRGKMRMPWEVTTMYTENLRALVNMSTNSPSVSVAAAAQAAQASAIAAEDDEDDEEDIEAQLASQQRLKEADEATKQMTPEEYVYYSECRQASFTYRKNKRFREFINAAAYIDVKPNDDIIDILGFLAYELVRELGLQALSLRDAESQKRRAPAPTQQAQSTTVTRGMSPIERTMDESADSARKRARLSPGVQGQPTEPPKGSNAHPTLDEVDGSGELCSLFSLPPSREAKLTAEHVQAAFARAQRVGTPLLTGAPRRQAGGLSRTRLFVI